MLFGHIDKEFLRSQPRDREAEPILGEDMFRLSAGKRMTERMRLIAYIALLAGSLDSSGCEAGHYDGVWEPVGVEAPSAEVVLDNLAGADLAAAAKLLRKPPDVTMRSSQYWVYEIRRKSVYRTCIEQDDETYAQNFLVVRATVRKGIVVDCDVQVRNLDGSVPASVEQLLTMPSGVLDDPLHACKVRPNPRPARAL
jgi:hypothetical protein